MKKLAGGIGIAAALSLGLASLTPASADGWRQEHWEHEWREHHPYWGYRPPIYYRPIHCYNQRIFVRGPWGWHPVWRRVCHR
ncbi:MAG: hypothetical protein KGQ37_02720 [Hyphomicrobiales bacterium]|nr:hypothetical protein [Hyphomicrobiales bacterium]